jgi:hypothetical protein
MDHNFGCAFTRQSPVETDARSNRQLACFVNTMAFSLVIRRSPNFHTFIDLP